MTNQIKFGINFRGHWDTYTHSEVANFIECADGLGDNELRGRYIAFLNLFLDKKVKPSTLVDYDVLEVFLGDIDNRADIDYREGHRDEEYEAALIAGGRYFHQISKTLETHLQANKPTPLTQLDLVEAFDGFGLSREE